MPEAGLRSCVVSRFHQADAQAVEDKRVIGPQLKAALESCRRIPVFAFLKKRLTEEEGSIGHRLLIRR
jgi:hypothetical protein